MDDDEAEVGRHEGRSGLHKAQRRLDGWVLLIVIFHKVNITYFAIRCVKLFLCLVLSLVH